MVVYFLCLFIKSKPELFDIGPVIEYNWQVLTHSYIFFLKCLPFTPTLSWLFVWTAFRENNLYKITTPDWCFACKYTRNLYYTSSASLQPSFSSNERVNDAESEVILRMRIVSPAVSLVYVFALDIHVVFALGRFCRWQSLPEKAKYIQGFVQEFRLASNVAIAMIWHILKRKNNAILVRIWNLK